MATGFTGLDNTVPADTAFIGDGASEIRSVKDALITVFPDVNGAITKPSDYGPTPGDTSPTEADYAQLFTDVYTLKNPEENNSDLIPQGLIAMWSGATDAPTVSALNAKGWFLCNGAAAPNGYVTPDMRDKFVKGYGAQQPAAGGGGTTSRTGKAVITGTTDNKSVAKTVSIGEANLPAHSHYAVSSDPDKYGADNAFAISTSLPNIKKTADSRGGIDGNYELQGTSVAPTNLGETSKWGNPSAEALNIGLSDTDFAHEHLLDTPEPDYFVVAYIIYAGVV